MPSTTGTTPALPRYPRWVRRLGVAAAIMALYAGLFQFFFVYDGCAELTTFGGKVVQPAGGALVVLLLMVALWRIRYADTFWGDPPRTPAAARTAPPPPPPACSCCPVHPPRHSFLPFGCPACTRER